MRVRARSSAHTQEVPEIRDDETQKTSTVFLAASKSITPKN